MTENGGNRSHLTELLANAVNGDVSARRQFLEALFQVTLIVPVVPGSKGDPLLIEHEGRKIIPLFSELTLMNDWTEQELPVVEKEFKVLLRTCGNGNWLHLNPGQEYGKEFSPWEIELLKNGPDAISEVLAEIESDVIEDLALEQGSHHYPELKKKLRGTLEVFPEIEEAFLVRAKTDDTENWYPLLVFRGEPMSADRRQQIREEVRWIAEGAAGEEANLVVADDPGMISAGIRSLLDDTTPFYFRHKQLDRRKQSSPKNPLIRWFSRLIGRDASE